jgi:hypothetical protein
VGGGSVGGGVVGGGSVGGGVVGGGSVGGGVVGGGSVGGGVVGGGSVGGGDVGGGVVVGGRVLGVRKRKINDVGANACRAGSLVGITNPSRISGSEAGVSSPAGVAAMSAASSSGTPSATASGAGAAGGLVDWVATSSRAWLTSGDRPKRMPSGSTEAYAKSARTATVNAPTTINVVRCRNPDHRIGGAPRIGDRLA